jgi:acetyltransferase
MTADALEHDDVPMAVLADSTAFDLRAVLPPFAVVRNPLDMSSQYLNDPTIFRKAIAILAGADEIGAIVFSLAMITGGYAESFADDIIDVGRSIPKPLTVCWTGGSVTEGGVRRLQDAGYPVFRRLGTAARAMAASGAFERAAARATGGDATPRAQDGTSFVVPADGLSEFEAETLLGHHGLPVVRGGLAGSREAAVALAEDLGYPVCLKVSTPGIRHKSDIGGVRLGLRSGDEVRIAFDDLSLVAGPSSAAVDILVQEMAPSGVEMIVGLQRDATYGWLVLVGSGGIFAEIFEDVALSPAPVDAGQAREMLERLRSYRLLRGVRGQAPRDVSALVDLIVRVSELPDVFGDQNVEVDLNPVLVLEEGSGVRCVDALISLADGATREESAA